MTRTRSWRYHRPAAVAAAVVATSVLWALIHAAGFDLQVPGFQGAEGPIPLGLGQVMVTTAAAALAAWGIAALLERRVRQARRAWMGITVVVFVLSLSGPLTSAGLGGADRGLLALFHAAVAAVVGTLLYVSLPRKGASR